MAYNFIYIYIYIYIQIKVYNILYIVYTKSLIKIDAGQQSILMVYVKMITIFFNFCLFKLLNKFIVMPNTLKKFYSTETSISNASYLPRLMEWTLWPISLVLNVGAKGKKIRNELFFVSFAVFSTS